VSEWTDCELAGEVIADSVGSLEWQARRCCKLSACLEPDKSFCAACIIPKLVKAVRAAIEFLQSPQMGYANSLYATHGGYPPWESDGKTIDHILAEALAYLDTAKGEKP